jgi:hypothetical protein
MQGKVWEEEIFRVNRAILSPPPLGHHPPQGIPDSRATSRAALSTLVCLSEMAVIKTIPSMRGRSDF